MGDPAAVADDKKSFVERLKMFIKGDFHVIELDLDTIKQRIDVGCAGSDLVKRVDHFNDTVKDAFWNDQAQIPGGGGKRRNGKAFPHAAGSASPSADQVAEALNMLERRAMLSP